jgi:DNA-binding transcriptional MerR regulator
LTVRREAREDQIYNVSMKSRIEPYMRSQEVADVLGITKRTLMNWLRTQFIPEPERNQANRYRRWTAHDVQRIRQIIAERNSD